MLKIGAKKKTAGKGGKRQSLILEVFASISIALVFTNITTPLKGSYRNYKNISFFICFFAPL